MSTHNGLKDALLSDEIRADNNSIDVSISEPEVKSPYHRELDTKVNNIQSGRPNLEQEMESIFDKNCGSKAIVFVCGPRGLSDSCRKICIREEYTFADEVFEF